MKVTHSLVNGQQNNFACLQPDRETGRERSNTMKNVISVQNSPDTILKSSDFKNRSADVIKAFFKKTIAAQSYNKMFFKGDHFKELGIALTDSSVRKSSLQSLQHLNDVSKNYLTKIKEKTQDLTSQERVLLSKVVDAKIHFRHQSNSNSVDASGILNIMSLNKLQSNEISTAKKYVLRRYKMFKQSGFCFFWRCIF
ncbi:hypothetical protein SAMN05216516_11084 [Izhakiella capsodis]|uniref:Uncharacterized protein n=2 Tax=Izhakiella capsodis TaxID=1367852 RepID=A0A1I5A0U7_9GAMM|nr:hypothetical protein SAMN05216516_11084 [Izhakiella capsodis]